LVILKFGGDIQPGFSYNHCTFDEYTEDRGDYARSHNLFSPEYIMNFGVKNREPNGFYASADVFGYGKVYFDTEKKYSRSPYTVVNTKIGYEANRLDIYFYGKNLFDQNAILMEFLRVILSTLLPGKSA
jgi:iron complex outermembrane receptor protein